MSSVNVEGGFEEPQDILVKEPHQHNHPPSYEVSPAPPPIRVLNKVAGLQYRLFRIACQQCEASLEFQAHHVQREHTRKWGYFLFMVPYEYREHSLVIECPVCDMCLQVDHLLPEWIRNKMMSATTTPGS